MAFTCIALATLPEWYLFLFRNNAARYSTYLITEFISFSKFIYVGIWLASRILGSGQILYTLKVSVSLNN